MNDATEYFYELTPERILESVEAFGLECTGRCLALNSMENRVYEVEITPTEEIRSPSDRFRVVKFYRPGRWTEEQILEEHRFLAQLQANEIPVVAPIEHGGKTLLREPHSGIWFAVFPKKGGRNPDELTDEQLERTGRLLARMHNIGGTEPAHHRLALTPQTYGLDNLVFLQERGILPREIAPQYEATVQEIVRLSEPLFARAASIRVHGDCHLGNILWGNEGPFLVDFDDMVTAPPVQDIWLILPGRDDEAVRQRTILLSAYEQMRKFDHATVTLIEPLRALRFIHYSAWIARRWADPAFPRVFPHFGTTDYWQRQLIDLREQVGIIQATV